MHVSRLASWWPPRPTSRRLSPLSPTHLAPSSVSPASPLRAATSKPWLRHAEAIKPSSDDAVAARSLVDVVDLASEAANVGQPPALEARVQAESKDLEARFALAGLALAAGRHREALEGYQIIVETDRGWRDEAARKAMLVVFGVIGARHPIGDEFRDRLRRVYY